MKHREGGGREGSRKARSQRSRVVEGGKTSKVESHLQHRHSQSQGSVMALTAYEGLFAQREEKPAREGQPCLWALLKGSLEPKTNLSSQAHPWVLWSLSSEFLRDSRSQEL